MAQLLLHGTNFVNFVGLHAWSGLEGGFQATRVTEWDEPQAVIGSYLHRFAYPDFYRAARRAQRPRADQLGARPDRSTASCRARPARSRSSPTSVQGTRRPGALPADRGEYMFVAEGRGGFRVYDIASIGNKGISDRIITAPFSPLGHNTRVSTRATRPAWRCRPTSRSRRTATSGWRRRCAPQPDGTHDQPARGKSGAAVPPDLQLCRGDRRRGGPIPRQRRHDGGRRAPQQFPRARPLATAPRLEREWRAHRRAAHHAGRHLRLHHRRRRPGRGRPRRPAGAAVTATLPLSDGRASAIQFRYLWVTDADGLKLFDVTRAIS